MADFDRTTYRPAAGTAAADIDAGLRAHFMKIYNYMLMGMVVSGAVGFFLATTPAAMQFIWGTPLKWVAMLAPVGIAIMMDFRVRNMTTSTAQFWFWAFSVAVGVSLSMFLFMFNTASLAKVFLVTGIAFGGASLYAYTTKADLSKMSSFLFMGAIGIIGAALVNLFLQSPAMHFALSCAVVLFATLMTAWETQSAKAEYYAAVEGGVADRAAIHSALSLYFWFFAIFKNLMFLMGEE